MNVGTLATSRFTKINNFFISGDAPNYHDHDFPLGYKITPMGYMILDNRVIETRPGLIQDENGRAQYKLSQSGQVACISLIELKNFIVVPLNHTLII